MKDAVEKILNVPNITDDPLKDETIGLPINKIYWDLRSEKSSTDGYIILLMGYAKSPFRGFESYFRIVVGLDEDDIQLILKQYNAKLVTYELDPAKKTIEDIQEAVYPFRDQEGTLQIEYDHLNRKTKLTLTRFGLTFETLRNVEKSLFHTSLGFTPYWEYKPSNAILADSPGVYTNDKTSNLCKINKIHVKCEVIDGSVVDGVRQLVLFTFVLDKLSGYKIFCEPETIHYKKILF